MSGHDHRARREVSRSTAGGLDPGVNCSACRRRIIIEHDSFVVVGPGERGYTCPACGSTVVLYSSRWLETEGA